MKVVIRDGDALQAVSPDALAAYARASGWTRAGSYGRHSDVYTAERLPELVLPRTQRLGDYASVVAQLIEIFARVAERDELSLYNDLVTANRDVVRVRVGESDDGSPSMNAGVDLIEGSRDMLLAVACSLREPQSLYRAGANREASDLLSQMRLAQTEHGSFVVALWTLSTSIGGNQMSVAVALKQSDYERAIQAHRDQAPVAIQGDLERSGQRWRLLNPRLTDVMPNPTNGAQGE